MPEFFSEEALLSSVLIYEENNGFDESTGSNAVVLSHNYNFLRIMRDHKKNILISKEDHILTSSVSLL